MAKHRPTPKTTIGDAIIAVVTVPLFIVWSLTGN